MQMTTRSEMPRRRRLLGWARLALPLAVLAGVLGAALSTLEPADAYFITPLHMEITFPGSEDGVATPEEAVAARITLGFDITPESAGVRWERIAAPRIGYGAGRMLRPDLIDERESWIEVSGGLVFEQTGTDRVAIAGLRGEGVQGAPAARADRAYLDCDHGDAAISGGSTRGECVVTIGPGSEMPRVAVTRDLTTGTYVLSAQIGMRGENSFRGVFTADGELSTLGGERLYQARAVIGVGQVHHVSTVQLLATSPGPNGAPQWPTNIEVGGNAETRFTLQIRGTDGGATDSRQIGKIVLQTDLGFFNDQRCTTRLRRVCTFSKEAIDALGRRGAGEISGIKLVSSPAVALTSVFATVTTANGIIYQSLPITVRYVGPARSLRLSPAETVLSNQVLADSDADVLTFTLSAFDAASRPAELPNGVELVIHDGFGIPVGIERAAVKRFGDQVQVSVVSRLPAGAYGLTARHQGMASTSTFTVAGPPSEVEVLQQTGTTTRIGDSVTMIARVSDALGTQVIDGTPVAFELPQSTRPALIASSAGPVRTMDGVARAVFAIVGTEATTVTARSGSASGSREFRIPQPAPAPAATEEPAPPAAAAEPELAELADSETQEPEPQPTPAAAEPSTAPAEPAPSDPVDAVRISQFSSWSGDSILTASELLRLLDGRGSRVYLWTGSSWLRYGLINGRSLPGAADFYIQPGDAIWVGA